MPESVMGVFLVGLRGSGKSAVGRALATELGLGFLDTDTAVEETTGCSPARWIEAHGIAAFRSVESDMIEDLAPELEAAPRVVALGGGSIESPRVESVLERLRRNARYKGVWLLAEPRVAAQRIEGGAEPRPRIAGRDLGEEIRVLFARRGPVFARLADLRFDTSEGDVHGLAARLAAALREPGL